MTYVFDMPVYRVIDAIRVQTAVMRDTVMHRANASGQNFKVSS